MGKIVYVVTAGEYSDYHIEAIFDSKRRAETYRKTKDFGCYGPVHTEVYPLNPRLRKSEKKKPKPKKRFWRVILTRKGDLMCADPVETMEPDRFGGRIENQMPAEFMTWMEAKTEKAAVKIANERRTAYLAAHRWPMIGEEIKTYK